MRFLLVTMLLVGCGKSDKSESAGLEMTSNSAACKKAMSCCVELVKLKKGGTKPEDVNLMCSGVALVKTDAECDQFRQGYAASFESDSKPVPEQCK